jgi:asparagine synthase (glutamine-hydrolysing)
MKPQIVTQTPEIDAPLGTSPLSGLCNPDGGATYRCWTTVRLSETRTCRLHGIKSAQARSAANALSSAADEGARAIGDWAIAHLTHGAAILTDGRRAVGVTDGVASTPLFVGSRNGMPFVDDTIDTFDVGEINRDGALSLALAGFTLGRGTLYDGIYSLRGGEWVDIDQDAVRFGTHARYICRPDDGASDAVLTERHTRLLLAILERMAAEAGGRPILVPLSAGLDSRAILSGLTELGYPNLRAFSYGLPGNHEAEGARAVAKALGVPWTMIGYDHRSQRAFFEGDVARRFFAFADRPDAMPFMQDVPALDRLKKGGELPDDAIIVNGQSGDFIAGNHIPGQLVDGKKTLVESVFDKHFDLWRSLKTPSALARVTELVETELSTFPEGLSEAARYELLEFEGRQARYVVAGQRAYEFFGLDWELPLWHPDYVAFWRDVPVSAKRGRRLFLDSMNKANWGGVWGPAWTFPHKVVPAWLRPIRFGAKVATAPFGRARWHAIDKRLFAWIMDPVLNYAVAPYGTVRRSREGFRNALSWHARRYLEAKGLSLDEVRGWL